MTRESLDPQGSLNRPLPMSAPWRRRFATARPTQKTSTRHSEHRCRLATLLDLLLKSDGDCCYLMECKTLKDLSRASDTTLQAIECRNLCGSACAWAVISWSQELPGYASKTSKTRASDSGQDFSPRAYCSNCFRRCEGRLASIAQKRGKGAI